MVKAISRSITAVDRAVAFPRFDWSRSLAMFCLLAGAAMCVRCVVLASPVDRLLRESAQAFSFEDYGTAEQSCAGPPSLLIRSAIWRGRWQGPPSPSRSG